MASGYSGVATPSTNPLKDLVVGYPKLAGKMEILPEIALFRRFGALNAENLLYLQAELAGLEEQLRVCQAADHTSSEGRRNQYAVNWYWLDQSENTSDAQQLELILKIRRTLKQYNKALIQQKEILSFAQPDQWDLEYLQNFLQTKEMGPLALAGPDATTWGSPEDRKSGSPDLVALRRRPKEDPVSTWIAENAISYLFRLGFARFMKPSRKRGMIGFQDTTILKITFWITSIVASLIPIASIAVLYCVHSMPARLGIIAGFNVLLTVCLSAFTSAKRPEVFAIAAAFAAVQVVFVGTNQSAPA